MKMNDNEILNLLLRQIRSDDRVIPWAVEEYEKLIARFDEEGSETIYSLSELDEKTEEVLKNLEFTGYITQVMRYPVHRSGCLVRIDVHAEGHVV